MLIHSSLLVSTLNFIFVLAYLVDKLSKIYARLYCSINYCSKDDYIILNPSILNLYYLCLLKHILLNNANQCVEWNTAFSRLPNKAYIKLTTTLPTLAKNYLMCSKKWRLSQYKVQTTITNSCFTTPRWVGGVRCWCISQARHEGSNFVAKGIRIKLEIAHKQWFWN